MGFEVRRSPEAVSLALAAFFVAVLNIPFWRLLYRTVEPRGFYDWAFMGALFVALFAVTYLAILIMATRPVLRPVMTLLLPLTAAASYFMLEYGGVIDVNMVRNIFETDTREAGDLFSIKLVIFFVVLGVVPAVMLWLVPISWRPLGEDVRHKFKSAVVALPLAAAVIFPFIPALTSTFRENIALRMTLTPSNYIGGLNKYLRSKVASRPKTIEPIAEDAKRVATGAKRQFFVIAIGETARADHWSLNGYARETTPQLAKVEGLVNFPDAFSCGTDTAYSVPCMFSGLGRDQFSMGRSASRQNLLDILARTGVDVVWRENQAGCKGICDRIKTEVLTGLKHPTFYAYSENHDEILLEGLAGFIKSAPGDTVVVMHMMGSHGPAYWKRYPDRFEVFKPACKEAQFSRCKLEEIVNAYDNTILYADHVLAKLTQILRTAADAGDAATGMIYMSDHGESLGENNIYLHGMPYAFAPAAQKHIPMAVWLSDSLRTAARVEQGCLAQNARAQHSHDNLFHSILGLFNIQTSIYESSLDLFAPCRVAHADQAPAPSAARVP